MSDLVEAHSRGATPRAAGKSTEGELPLEGSRVGPAFGGKNGSNDADLDTDLEAYLQVWARVRNVHAGFRFRSHALMTA